jgi:prevent-host-death family protein
MKAGVREVRDRFTHYLDQVRRGREVIVTERGREVAALIPLRNQNSVEDAVARLQTEGLVEVTDSWRPLAMSSSSSRLRGRLLSELIVEERTRSW